MTAAQSSRYLDRRALESLGRMRFAARRRVEGSYSGRHQSRQQGGAGEFVDYREYSGGEDLRRLDWKIYARTGKAFVRLHQEETNLICTLAIDASGSMAFGGGRDGRGSKLDYAQYLSASLAYVINSRQDQVGLAVLRERLGDFLPPSGAALQLHRILEGLEKLRPEPTTRSAASLRDLFDRTTRRGVLIVLSDFLMDDLDEVFAALRLFRHRGTETIALHLIHPEEESLPEGTAYRFEGLENDGYVSCSPAEIRSVYREKFAAHVAAVRRLAGASDCDYRRISTADSYLQTLGGFLVERSG